MVETFEIISVTAILTVIVRREVLDGGYWNNCGILGLV